VYALTVLGPKEAELLMTHPGVGPVTYPEFSSWRDDTAKGRLAGNRPHQSDYDRYQRPTHVFSSARERLSVLKTSNSSQALTIKH
jgi:hypothetical protein